MELKDENQKILIINIYAQFLDRSDLDSKIDDYISVLASVGNIINVNPSHAFIVLGDLNCNIHDRSHPFTPHFSKFLAENSLISVYDLDSTISIDNLYTRFDKRSKSLLDYIFVGNSIVSSISNVRVSHYAENTSDHLPERFSHRHLRMY